jgi:hypothetical protein
VIDTDGFQMLADDDVAVRANALLGGPERGGEEA